VPLDDRDVGSIIAGVFDMNTKMDVLVQHVRAIRELLDEDDEEEEEEGH
jgi:hypothetical protein